MLRDTGIRFVGYYTYYGSRNGCYEVLNEVSVSLLNNQVEVFSKGNEHKYSHLSVIVKPASSRNLQVGYE